MSTCSPSRQRAEQSGAKTAYIPMRWWCATGRAPTYGCSRSFWASPTTLRSMDLQTFDTKHAAGEIRVDVLARHHDKYWMAARVLPRVINTAYLPRHALRGAKSYQADYNLPHARWPPAKPYGHSAAVRRRQVVDTLRAYEHSLGIQRFDLAVDWGWFIVVTQPLFWLLGQTQPLFRQFRPGDHPGTVVIRLVSFRWRRLLQI